MRKLTGYIGALIIVFALMGSIFAGYALNVNGSSTVVNEYERVTDVSGLYSHTQEPSYIDYNPASNYIGYATYPTYNNVQLLNYTNHYKEITNGTITVKETPGVIINGGAQYTPADPYYAFICDYFYLYYESSTDLTYYSVNSISRLYGDATITINNGTVSITKPGGTITTYNNVTKSLAYTGADDWDYRVTIGSNTLPYGPFYLNNVPQIIGVTANARGIYTGESWKAINNPGVTETVLSAIKMDDMVGNVASYTFMNIKSAHGVFYPKSVSGYDIGINYTESNRVNNYLMETTYTGGSTQTVTQTLNLSPGMGLTDYWGAGSALGQVPRMWRANSMSYDYNGNSADIGMPTYTTQSTSGYTDNLRFYNVFDILSYYNISTDKQITIKAYGTADYLLNNGESIGDNNFTKLMSSGFYSSPGFMDNKLYCIYNPDTQTFDYYDKNDVKMQTSNQCYVAFCGNSPRYGPIVDYAGNIYGYYDFGTRPTPHLDISYETQTGGTTTYHYSDITKGYSIKDDNIANVVWNNEYYNGNIQILFRADNTIGTYHNDIIVGDNTISIDYTNGGYSVALNGADPIAVGKWRNIVLDINLRNGELNVIPVRTFNSYTNVVLDTASIVIGDLVNPTPTNIIEWAPTSNSLMFNVYSTSVFMNTYGIVMVNPQLNITDYFTDLNGFYRMRLYNFSVLGNSITVNGVTADVSNNSITIDGQTVQIKDMAVTYADGHAYISDSNANIDLGEIVDNNISMAGSWYFETELLKGYTSQKMVYEWDWGDFILNNTQFCIMYIGIALIGLIVARRYCSLSITDYIVLIASFAIALTVQVIA